MIIWTKDDIIYKIWYSGSGNLDVSVTEADSEIVVTAAAGSALNSAGTGTVAINGGTFTSEEGNALNAATTGDVTITGGTFVGDTDGCGFLRTATAAGDAHFIGLADQGGENQAESGAVFSSIKTEVEDEYLADLLKDNTIEYPVPEFENDDYYGVYANQPTASLTGVEMRGDVIIKATSTAKRTVTVDIDNVKKDGTVAYQFYQGVTDDEPDAYEFLFAPAPVVDVADGAKFSIADGNTVVFTLTPDDHLSGCPDKWSAWATVCSLRTSPRAVRRSP